MIRYGIEAIGMLLDERQIYEGKLFRGVLCCESASAYWKLTTYAGTPITAYSNSKIEVSCSYLKTIYRSFEDRKNIIAINEIMEVTTREQTICDLILNESSEEFIFQAIDCYLDENEDKSVLYNCAVENCCLEKLNEYIANLPDWYSMLDE